YFNFFFSSRRRHTISKRDWSSDVCSSDLYLDSSFHSGASFWICQDITMRRPPPLIARALYMHSMVQETATRRLIRNPCNSLQVRSEERRVGKERVSHTTPGKVAEQYGAHK